MVAVLTATGSTESEIALRVGLSAPTLKKYYFRELQQAAGLARQVLIETMWAKALGGNVAAARFIREEFPKGDAEAYLQRTTRRDPPAPRLGKKEQAQEAAQTAGRDTEWGDDLVGGPIN